MHDRRDGFGCSGHRTPSSYCCTTRSDNAMATRATNTIAAATATAAAMFGLPRIARSHIALPRSRATPTSLCETNHRVRNREVFPYDASGRYTRRLSIPTRVSRLRERASGTGAMGSAQGEQGNQSTDCADKQNNGDRDDSNPHARRRVTDSHLIKHGCTFFVQKPFVFSRGTDLRQMPRMPEFPRLPALVSHPPTVAPHKEVYRECRHDEESRGRVGPAERLEQRLGALLRTLVARSLADS